MKTHFRPGRLLLITSALACALLLLPPPPRPPAGATTAAAAAPEPPPVAARDRTGVELMYVPRGSFRMGSERRPDEQPVHKVKFGEGFYAGKYEVTQGQWRAVMGTSVGRQRDKANPSWKLAGEGDDYPVYYVSWDEAQEFIRRLNALDDVFTYRLPSEAEWEYACRAGNPDTYASWPLPLDALAWWEDNSGGQSHPVGRKLPNKFGLYDMHGNVWEWCEDYYHESYEGAPSDGSARLRAGATGYRVMRGGSWDHQSVHARSANRDGLSPQTRGNHIGLRVAADVRRR